MLVLLIFVVVLVLLLEVPAHAPADPRLDDPDLDVGSDLEGDDALVLLDRLDSPVDASVGHDLLAHSQGRLELLLRLRALPVGAYKEEIEGSYEKDGEE